MIDAAQSRSPADRNGAGHLASITSEDIFTSQQIAELLHLRRSTVEDYARRGLLPSIKLGRHRRFIRGDVEAALNELRRRSG